MLRVISDTAKPVKIWASDLEPEAEIQIRNLASLPFIYSHVAVMPDAHAGRGSTVGTVIATKGAIIPAAVGVDIGCFTGDTKVLLISGQEPSLKELIEQNKEIYIWACKPDGEITAAKATVKKTRENAEVIKITLDNEKTIICTPDHKFMLRDGTYLRADLLTTETSLMPIYTIQDGEGYTLIKQNSKGKSYQRAHWIVGRSGLMGNIPKFENQKTIIHHKDFKKSNNSIENLAFMGDKDHSSFHRSLVEKNTYWQSEEFELKRVEGIRKKIKEDPDFLAQKQAIGTKNIVAYMKNNPEHFLETLRDNGERGKTYLIDYNKSEKGKKKSSEIAHLFHKCGDCGAVVQGGFGLHNHRKKQHSYNHKIVSVEKLETKEDVFCLIVPGYNNFALSAGVFVHNCGMCALKLPFKAEIFKDLPKLRHSIERSIPTGKHANKELSKSAELAFTGLGQVSEVAKEKMRANIFERSALSIGTLGGGNHFIEICSDTNGDAWIMLHSGSRNIGKCLAEIHIDKAKDLMKSYFIKLPDPDLAYLAQSTPEFKSYLHDLMWAQNFAMANRNEMMDRVLREVLYHVGGMEHYSDIKIGAFRVNCHHNYTAIENHNGANVYVTRKGAVSARTGEYGIIPGSMGTKSFIVTGNGNSESFCSCSHGAGRVMSRTKARQVFTAQDLAEQTRGVECAKTDAFIDEIPGAYKDIGTVMKNQADLVSIAYELKQLLCVKGD